MTTPAWEQALAACTDDNLPYAMDYWMDQGYSRKRAWVRFVTEHYVRGREVISDLNSICRAAGIRKGYSTPRKWVKRELARLGWWPKENAWYLVAPKVPDKIGRVPASYPAIPPDTHEFDVWTTATGERVRFADMTNSHLRNTIALMRRQQSPHNSPMKALALATYLPRALAEAARRSLQF